ncbi:MAG TPA: hypothetical protein VNJ70_08190 [Thermoanaerobaculia bacterium]|nr:hypothetical protein [Thermoanaerobaculia bacterium]
MKFLVDNHLSYRLADALGQLADYEGDTVVHIRNKFGEGVKDVEWVPRLASEGEWVIVSGDCKIRTKPQERQVFFAAQLTTFFLAPGWTNCGFWEQAFLLVKWWPKIGEQARLVERGRVFEVPYRHYGRFKLLPP